MADKWKRPESVPLPSVWARCEGRKPMANGKIPKFRVQDAPLDMKDELVDFMVANFLPDEPLTSFVDIASDPEAVEEIKLIWSETFDGQLVLVALLDNPEDFEGENIPNIAGVNWTIPVVKGDKDYLPKTDRVRKVLGFINMASHTADVYEKYNVDAQLYALGLSVAAVYRGQGLGEEIVRARFPLGRAVGLPLTSTVFTGIASQTIGQKCGMELLYTLLPEEYKEDGIAVFKGIKTNCLKYMAVRIS